MTIVYFVVHGARGSKMATKVSAWFMDDAKDHLKGISTKNFFKTKVFFFVWVFDPTCINIGRLERT